MSDCEKAAVYETFLIDLFQVFSERYGTLQKARAELTKSDRWLFSPDLSCAMNEIKCEGLLFSGVVG